MIDLRVRDEVRGIDVNLSDKGYIVTDIVPSSIEINRGTRHMLGTDGTDESVVDEISRDIKVDIQFVALDKKEFVKKTDYINWLFGTKNVLIITRRHNEGSGYGFEKPNADILEELPFFEDISWEVGMNGKFEPDRSGLLGSYSFNFTTLSIPYGFTEEEVIKLTGQDFITNIGSWGQIAKFNYFGNKELNQLKLPLIVTLKKIKAASRFEIDINGSINLNSAISNLDVITLDGYGYYINQANTVRNTNKGFFKLLEGENTVHMNFTQTTDFTVELKFRHYYY